VESHGSHKERKMQMESKESRHFPRINLTTPLRCQIRGLPDFSNTLTENISLNGIGFIDNDFIAPLTQVMLEIQIMARVLKPICKIIRSNPFPHSNKYHFGAEFLELESNEKKFLSEFITMKLNQTRGA